MLTISSLPTEGGCCGWPAANHRRHGLPVGHADGVRRLELPLIDGDDAAADDFGHICAGVDGDDENGREGRIHVHARVLRAVVDHDGLHDHRRAAKHLNVDVHQELRQPEQPAPEGHADVRAGFLLLRQGDGADDGHQRAGAKPSAVPVSAISRVMPVPRRNSIPYFSSKGHQPKKDVEAFGIFFLLWGYVDSPPRTPAGN